MAGFSIVLMTLFMFLVVGVFFIGAQICAVLGIVFSVLTIKGSNKYLGSGGKYPFRTLRNYHRASFVFFIISWIAAGFWLLILLSAFVGYVGSNELAFEFYNMILTFTVFCGSSVACIIIKSLSFKKYRMAKELSGNLAAAGINVCRPGYGGGTFQQSYSTRTDHAGAPVSSDTVYCSKCGGVNKKENHFCRFCGEKLV